MVFSLVRRIKRLLGDSSFWIREEHASERATAMRMGLRCKTHVVSATQQEYLDVVIDYQEKIGSIRLTAKGVDVFIHRSSKKRDVWQASTFVDNKVTGDREYATAQEALDKVREEGFVLHTLMQIDGSSLT